MNLLDNDVIKFNLQPSDPWVRSEFPSPLVTVDYDKTDNIIAVTVVGAKHSE
jgi:hypothetical protein